MQGVLLNTSKANNDFAENETWDSRTFLHISAQRNTYYLGGGINDLEILFDKQKAFARLFFEIDG